jgi:hypothetical protein
MKKQTLKIIVAGDKNFKPFVENAVNYNSRLGYKSLVYDLGELGFGTPFTARFSDEVNAKIPSKPHIVEHALMSCNDGEFVVWLDADALIVQPIDDIIDNYDVGVTLRQPKLTEHSLPINAGIVFFKKSQPTMDFISKWKSLCDKDISDQPPLNQLCKLTSKDIGSTIIRDGVRIKGFPCRIYNNFYFAKKNHPEAKIKHYKSKLRHLYPFG